MFVQEPTPHAKNFFCGGIWVCNCGETDCPYMESGYSPKKEPAPPVLNQWKPDLTMNGSSSTDCARAQAQSGVPKVTYVSARESTRRRDVSLPGVENHRRTNLLPDAISINLNLTNFYEPQFGSRIKGACSLLKPARSTREATEA